MKSIIRLIPTIILLCACTTYQPEGFAGGFREVPLATDTYRVTASGNAFVSHSKTTAIAYTRAAVLSKEHGYDRFLILGFDEWTRTSTVTSPGSATTTYTSNTSVTGYGNTAYGSTTGSAHTSISPPTTQTYNKPVTDIVVKFVSIDSSEYPKALSVEQVLSRYGPIAGYKPTEQDLSGQ